MIYFRITPNYIYANFIYVYLHYMIYVYNIKFA